MVLTLKRWKSRSSPGIIADGYTVKTHSHVKGTPQKGSRPAKKGRKALFYVPDALATALRKTTALGGQYIRDATSSPIMVTRGGAARRPVRHRRNRQQKLSRDATRSPIMVTRGGAAR